MSNISKHTGWILGGVTAGCLMFCGCRREEDVAPAIPRVKVITVGQQASGQSRRISGTLKAAKESALSFGVAGQVINILSAKGDTVEEGQLLAELDPQSLQIRLDKSQDKVAAGRAALAEAQQTYDRTSTLMQQRGASQQEMEKATSGLASVKTSLQTAQSELEQAKINLNKASLKAPFSGRIGSVPAERFQEVTAGTTIMTLLSSDAMEVHVRVPESMIRRVDYGQAVKVSFPALPDLSPPGVVTEIAAEAADGNAFPVTVALSDQLPDLRAGLTASVTFNFDRYLEGRTVYLIPLSALAVNAGVLHPENYAPEPDSGRHTAPLFILDAEAGLVHERKVVIGKLRDNAIEVYEGLKAGELVVTAGVAFLNDGMAAEQWNPEMDPVR